MDVTHRHCDVHHPAFWQTIHTLRVIETNALGSETTFAQLRLHELRKITYKNGEKFDLTCRKRDLLQGHKSKLVWKIIN